MAPPGGGHTSNRAHTNARASHAPPRIAAHGELTPLMTGALFTPVVTTQQQTAGYTVREGSPLHTDAHL